MVERLFNLRKIMTDQEHIDTWNEQVETYIREHGTYETTIDDRVFKIEVECYNRDNSISGFVGWYDDDHSVMILADTPYEVYCEA